MVSDYKNADGDYRGALERYLPTAYKTIGNGSDVHRGLLGALKQMLVTTEQDIIDGTRQVFLANANSWALDLYGDWVGESRKGDLDDDYRARIIEKITLGRSTVGNIIKGIKREINDPDLTVSVYEPWRNIFILNKSFLNGTDRLMGKFYRYAVVQVTLNKYVNALELQMIADKYKSAGVSLVFVYREGIVAGDGALLALPLKLITENRNTITRNRSQLLGTLLMNGLPTGTKATDLSTVGGRNLYITETQVAGYINGADGTLAAQNRINKEMASDYIAVLPNTEYTFQAWGSLPSGQRYWASIGQYGSDKSFLDRSPGLYNTPTATTDIPNDYEKTTFTTSANTYFVRVSSRTYGNYRVKFEQGNLPTDWNDVLASDPNSVYRGVYGTVPSKNIFGTTAPTAGMTSDPYDFIFQQSKVDLSTVGGRNLYITETQVAGYINGADGTLAAQNRINKEMASDYIAVLPNTEYTFQAWGSLPSGQRYWASIGQYGSDKSFLDRSPGLYNTPTATTDIPNDYEKTTFTTSANTYFVRVSSRTYGNYRVKFEQGNLPTDWTPAPEDTPKIYIHPYKGTDYTTLNRLDGVTETVTASGLPTVAFNISEYVKGVLEAKALNDSNGYGRNLLLGTRDWTDNTRWNRLGTVTTDMYRGMVIAASGGAWSSPTYSMRYANILQVGKTYTFSTYVRNTSDTDTKVAPYYEGEIVTPMGTTTPLPAHTDWVRVSITFQCVKDPTTSTANLRWEGQNALTNGFIQFAGYKLEEGNLPTDWTPAPEDNPTAVDYTNFSTPVSSINVNLKGSPFGLAPTTITVLSQGATPLTGKWYKNGTLISPQTTQVSDATTPTGTWSFKLDTPTLVSSVTLTDNYPDATGAYRVITMTTTDNRELVILNTTQQVTGTINTLRLQTQTPEIYRPYIKSAMIGDTTLSSPQVFDASTGNWVAITKSTNLVPYIAYGDVTNALYVTLRNKTTQQNIDYLGLDITQVSVEGQ